MNRRQFLKATAAGAAVASCLTSAGGALAGADNSAASSKPASDAASAPATQPGEFLSVCGLYCGICKSKIDGKCHGCGCACGKCSGKAHKDGCDIARCAAGRKKESCADCKDMPCSMVIQFANDWIWRTHAPVIENLRRRKAIGDAAWIKEQAEFWKKDKDAAAAWIVLYEECDKRYAEYRKKHGTPT